MANLRCIALVLALAAASPSLLSAQSTPAQATSAATRDVVRGVVLMVDPALGAMVQTADAVIAVQPRPAFRLKAGDRIEARGLAVDRDGHRTLADADVLQQTPGAVPPPRRTTVPTLTNDTGDWIELDVVVQEATARDGHIELRLPSIAWPIAAVVPASSIPVENLVDAEVRLRGIRQIARTPQGAVGGIRIVAVAIASDGIRRAAAPAFELPIVTAAAFRSTAAQLSSDHRARVRGTVVMQHQAFTPGRRVVHVQDATGGLIAEVLDDSGITEGDLVDVVGFPSQLFGTPLMGSGAVRRIAGGQVPPPVTATPGELLAGTIKQTYVRTRATFVEATNANGTAALTFDAGGIVVSAYLFDSAARAVLPPLRKGTVVDLTGVYQVQFAPGTDVRSIVLTLGNPTAIAVIQTPSWWTPFRLTAAALTGAGLLAMAIVWMWVLNARVQARTRAFEDQFRRASALQRRWTDLVATASDVILTWDLQGRILSANNAAETLTGLPAETMRDRTLLDLAAPESADAVTTLLAEQDHESAPRTAVIELPGPGGATVPLEMSVQPMFDEAQAHVGSLAIGRNIAMQRRAEAALRAARDAAEDANRAKSEFLANMSHEIRTPMNGIIGMTELALTTDLTVTQREYLQTVKVSGESLLGLLNGILDFSKIESRKLELESVPFGLRDVVADALKPLGFTADEKKLELLCEIAPEVPDALVGDPLRVRQILTNLVSNALKFTTRGHVHVAISEDRRADGCTRLLFSVSDTGSGIPDDKHATIFEPFSQADGSTTRRFGGTGLGLAISATLVRMMGGRIWVESTVGRGSTFHFTAGFDVTTTVEPSAVEPLLANLPVLVVDDNPINRRIFADQLARWGMKASLADGGCSAIAALDAAAAGGEPYLLVLLDANMPEIDGFGVAEHIHSRPALAGATIMMLTSSGEYGDAERCRALNIAAYLTKPIAPRHLFDAICRVVGSGRTQAAALTRPARPEARPVAAQPRRVLLAEDNIVNQRVAIGLLVKRGHEVTLATNGREALDAIERADAPFDLVLMDVQMPEMGGLEATEEIRRRETGTGRRIRIVAMTAHAMNGDREQCLSAGMDGYLSKPVNPGMLYAVVEQEAPVDSQVAPARADVPPVDRQALRERLNGDDELFSEVIQVFLDDCPSRLAAIRSALDRRDAGDIAQAAQALKGAAGNLSAASLFGAAQTLEQLARERRLDAWEAAWRELSIEASHVMDMLRRFEPARTPRSETRDLPPVQHDPRG